MTYKTALITGGAIRIGKDICKKLHENGYNIICHYNKSENEAKDLKSELNKLRENSCEIFCLDLNDFDQVEELVVALDTDCDGTLSLKELRSMLPPDVQYARKKKKKDVRSRSRKHKKFEILKF